MAPLAHDIHWLQLRPPQAPPQQAETLLGSEVHKLFSDPHQQPIIVAAARDDAWLAAMLVLLEPEHDAASIHQLVVTPAARGQGLGGRLVRKAIHLAREHDLSRVRSTAGFGCPDHRRMYQRLQFDDVDEPPYLMARPA